MKFESKLISVKIRGKKSGKQLTEIEISQIVRGGYYVL